jgi:26S proteasome regulatory subunit T5
VKLGKLQNLRNIRPERMDIEREIFDDVEDSLPEEFAQMSAEGISQRARLLDNELRVLKDESSRMTLEQGSLKEKIKENKVFIAQIRSFLPPSVSGCLNVLFDFIQEKIKLNNQLPYLVGNIVEVLDVQPEDEEEEDGAAIDLDSQRKGKCVVLKTTTRQTIFLPVVGLVDAEKLKPGDLVSIKFCLSPAFN